MPEIVIVGSGIVTAAGRGPERTLVALVSGGRDPAPPRAIVTPLATRHPVFEVDDKALARPGERLPRGRGSRSLRLALAAAADAVGEATNDRRLAIAPHRIGVVVGATVGGMNHAEEWIESCTAVAAAGGAGNTARGSERRAVAARAAIRHLPLCEIPGTLGDRFEFNGPSFAVSTACTSGAQAIATAGDLIATGVCDAVLAGGVDCLARLTYHGFAALGVMSERRCTPFDAGRSGLNLGEGAAFMLLARADLVRGAARLPRLAGWGSNTDAHHMTAPRPDGSGVAAALRSALGLGGVAPSDVGWIHAHGTATTANDAVESAAVRSVFGTYRVPVSSTKHVFGHTLGAAGSIAGVVALQAFREGFLPGNAAITTPDRACDVDVVPPRGIRTKPGHILVSSLGFGGASCALLFAAAAR